MYKKKRTVNTLCTSPIAFFLFGLVFLLPSLLIWEPKLEELQVTTVEIFGLDSETRRSGRFGTTTKYYLVTSDGTRYRISGSVDYEELGQAIRETYREINGMDNWFNPDNKDVVQWAKDGIPVTAEIRHQDGLIYTLSIDGVEYVRYNPSGVPLINIFGFAASALYFAIAIAMVRAKRTGGKWASGKKQPKYQKSP